MQTINGRAKMPERIIAAQALYNGLKPHAFKPRLPPLPTSNTRAPLGMLSLRGRKHVNMVVFQPP